MIFTLTPIITATTSGHALGMDDPAYKLLQAWMLAHKADPDAAAMISQQFLAGRISPEQAVRAWLEVIGFHRRGFVSLPHDILE